MEFISFISIIIVALIIFFVRGIMEEKRRNKDFLQKLRDNYGTYPDREYSYEEFESLTHYYTLHKQEGDVVVDDITWNDLDMDSIFMLINQTQSSAGQEYLYDMLRHPLLDAGELQKRDKLVSWFMEHEKERIAIQNIFASIGRTRMVSISDYLYRLHDVRKESSAGHYMLDAAILFAAAFLFISPSWGIVLFMLLVGFSIMRYFRRKAEIEPYIISFAYLLRLLKGCDDLCKYQAEQLSEYQKKLSEAAGVFKKFRRFHYILTSGKRLSGDMIELFLDYLRMIFHVDLIKFNSMLHDVTEHQQEVEEILKNMGVLEAAIAIGSFRKFLPAYAIPRLYPYEERDGHAYLNVQDGYHPMLKEPVLNSIETNQSVLLTGSNASGKSTFLKTMAINAILAQTVYTVPAKDYEATFFRIYSSMALTDDLNNSESYYIVEIKSLKRILDAAGMLIPVLCFVDEVLRGTNTVERIAASSRVLQSLNRNHVICFAATHDIELTHLLEQEYVNYHFEEEIHGDTILFPYRLLPGRAVTRNAIKLLRLMGYQEDIVECAEKTAEKFLKDGEWDLKEI